MLCGSTSTIPVTARLLGLLVICACLCVNRSIRVIVRTTATFSRETEGLTLLVSGHFASHPQLVNNARDLDTDQIVHELNLAVEQFNAGFVLDAVENFSYNYALSSLNWFHLYTNSTQNSWETRGDQCPQFQ